MPPARMPPRPALASALAIVVLPVLASAQFTNVATGSLGAPANG